MTPDEILAAQVGEDEALAKAAASRPLGGLWGGVVDGTRLTAVSAHTARHDPARVLREVTAKRKILTEYETSHGSGPDFDGGYSAGLEFAVRCLAEVFEDAPQEGP